MYTYIYIFNMTATLSAKRLMQSRAETMMIYGRRGWLAARESGRGSGCSGGASASDEESGGKGRQLATLSWTIAKRTVSHMYHIFIIFYQLYHILRYLKHKCSAHFDGFILSARLRNDTQRIIRKYKGTDVDIQISLIKIATLVLIEIFLLSIAKQRHIAYKAY